MKTIFKIKYEEYLDYNKITIEKNLILRIEKLNTLNKTYLMGVLE